MSIKLFQFI